MIVKELLLSGGFWVLNKKIVSKYGLECSLLLTVLAEAQSMFESEWFFQTSETIEVLTGMSKHIQTNCIEKLKKDGILDQKNQGLPMKRYFKINYNVIEQQVFENLESKKLKILTTRSEKIEHYKEHTYKEHNINNTANANVEKKVYLKLPDIERIKLTQEDLNKLIEKFKDKELVWKCMQEADNWLLAKGQTMKNYKAYLTNWINRALDKKEGAI